LRELVHLQDRIDRVFTGAHGLPGNENPMTPGAWVPPVDIYQNGDHEMVLKAELPDMTREDIEITLDKGLLAIKGEKRLASDVNEERFHRIERSYGTFSRSFSLPQSVDASRISAEYRSGVLTVRLPLREEAKPRQIKVDVAA
jgi:HSP20 family protein